MAGRMARDGNAVSGIHAELPALRSLAGSPGTFQIGLNSDLCAPKAFGSRALN